MNAARFIIVNMVVMTVAISCSKATIGTIDGPNERPSEQSFTVVVESVGELFTGGEGVNPTMTTRRPISSVTPTQTFDKLSLIIVEYRSPAKVVYKTTIDNWSNPNNKASIPWSEEEGQGRYATIRLSGDECLDEGMTYMAYAIGYQSGTYGDYEPFAGIEVGDNYNKTETATVPTGGRPEEVFAGAEIFSVQHGKILSKRSEEAEFEHALLLVRRQVAGTFGYFTRIPAKIQDVPVSCLRLVATHSNQTVIFGGFRGVDDSYDFHKDNVVNGMDPQTDFNASLAGSTQLDAFTVYEIELANWFPGNREDARLPYDANGDGYLDAGDENWQTDPEAYPAGTISLSTGSVFGDKFVIPFAVTRDDVDFGRSSFQLQLLGVGGAILKHWNVTLRDLDAVENERRTLVSLPDGETGRTQISELENIDTESCFSIVRNRFYTMGEKSQSQNYGEDMPVDLRVADNLVMDARHQWQIQNSIIFN